MILIAGGTGHLGPQLVGRLLDRGLSVRVLTRDPDRARTRLGPGPELVIGDARNIGELGAALTGIDSVVSAMTGFGPGGQGTQAVDRDGNRNLIRAAQATGVRRFVLVSMHGASHDHEMELMRMKHAAEETLRSSALEWVIVRPNVFMELWVDLMGDPIVRKGSATVFGRGDNAINFNSAQDVAKFVELALTDPALTRTELPVGGPDNLTLNQLADRIARAAGRKVAVRHVPLPLMRMSVAAMRRLKPDVAGLIEAGIAMDSAEMSFDASGLRERFPEVELTPVAEVLERRFGAGIKPAHVKASITTG